MRSFMFDVLQASFPHAETILRADKAAAAGRDEYDDAYFDLLYRDTRPILEQRLSAAVSGSGLGDRRRMGRRREAGASAGPATGDQEGQKTELSSPL